jgi:RNA polymerase sigma-70 factor (ECF subfamily)
LSGSDDLVSDAESGGREPKEPGRVLSRTGQGMSYEMVERGPAVSAPRREEVDDGPQQSVDDPDRELVARWKSGDMGSFEELVRRHEKRVFRLLLRMLGNREEAEDVAQETFLSLYRHGKRFRGESRFSTFVYRVAANAALNRRRSLGRNRARMEKLVERQAAGDDLPTSPRDAASTAEAGEVGVEVRRALETLSPNLRLPLVLYDIEGLAYGEIARVLGVAEGTVKSRIHRARQALRDELRDYLAASAEGTPP